MTKRNRRYKGGRLRYQFIVLLLVVLLIPMLFIFSLLISRAQNETILNSLAVNQKTVEHISAEFDELNSSIINVSEQFADDRDLLELIAQGWDTQADERALQLRRVNMMALKNRFIEADTFNSSLTIGGIYTPDGEFFNFYGTREDRGYDFLDPVPEEIYGLLRSLDVDSEEKLAKVVWYSLHQNGFTDKKFGDPRQENILLGSRRTYNRYLGHYLCTHIFILPEQLLYDRYSVYLHDDEDLSVFVLDEEMNVISGSDTAFLEGRPPEELREWLSASDSSASLVMENGTYLVSHIQSDQTGWYVVMLARSQALTQTLDNLYRGIIIAVGISFLLYLCAILFFSSTISTPLSEMAGSMRQVEKGHFQPVTPSNYRNEIGEITHYYNRMVGRLEKLMEEQERRKALEMRVLKGQINPHFVYNTLETIVWKANFANQDDIALTASQLGKLLRMSVQNNTPTIPLEQEINQTLLYIEIQKMRYKERLEFRLLPYDPVLGKCRIIHFVLQPIIENAFIHAMRPKGVPLSVEVKIEQEEEQLILRVRDDGVGMNAERLNSLRAYLDAPEESTLDTRGSGIGLHNIHERLHLYYGEGYGVTIDSQEGKGTEVSICVPLIPPEED